MKWYDIEQNSPEWDELRAGRLTASNFATIMVNQPQAFNDAAKRLAVQIAFERINGHSMRSHYGDGYRNADMERGHIEEPAARALYEAETFCTVQNGGFFCDDYIGCSPDGLIGEEGGIEIKSVLPQTHAATKRRGSFDPAYGWQILGNLTHSGREWWDFVSYCSFAPEPYQLLVYRIHREQYRTQIQQLLAREQRFIELVQKQMKEFL